jgi:3-hydroxybutyryl-CoA dehydrogenase
MIKKISTVAVIGSGTMGQGIAQVCATAGYEVLLYDIQPALLETATEGLKKSMEALTKKGKISAEEATAILSRIHSVPDFEKLRADLIIEAVTEKLEVKQKLFQDIEKINNENCLLATNTSSIPVTRIAAALKRPERLAGLHFFNPAPVMKLVEIVQGVSTGESILNVFKQFCTSLNKQFVLTQDSPGFIVNRVARHFYLESLRVVEEQVADFQTTDTLLKATGFKMGPFELMDLIGVDVNFSVTVSMYNSFHQDPKFRPSRLQQQKIDAGQLGRKSGKGFYEYP